jgi:ABC-type hemin transport system ATPase subunit/ABC-type Fe3+-siderophore transport system permease subunit
MRDKPNVGYFRALSVEGVLSLRPTHVLATEGAGPPDALKLIAEAGVRVERLSEDLTPKGVTDRIRRIGQFAGAPDRAEALAAEVEGRFAALARQPAAAPRKRVLFVLSLQNGRALVGGRKTAADAMIALAGATNAAEAVEGYKPLTDEGIISAATRRRPDDEPRQSRGGGRRGLFPRRLRRHAAARTRALGGYGRALPARLRAAHAGRRARPDGGGLWRDPGPAERSPVTVVADAAADVAAHFESRRRRIGAAILALAVLLALLAIASLGTGAVAIPADRVVAVLVGWLTGDADILASREALVILSIRMPRVALGCLIGAALAVSGALMQGLFRNPLADPGLVGVSSGAALAAGATIVLGDRILGTVSAQLPFILLPFGAFFGGLASTLILYAIATRHGRTSVAIMLLAGVALGAFTGSLTGLLAFVSDDRQLRDLTFWSLGSLSGASWTKVATVTPLILPVLFCVPFLARGLNALLLGEAEAFHLGIAVQRLKRAAILMVAVAVGASVAVSRRHRLRRHRRAAPAPPGVRAGPPCSPAAVGSPRGGAADRGRPAGADAGQPGRTAHRHPHGSHRGAVLPVAAAAPRPEPRRMNPLLQAEGVGIAYGRHKPVDQVSLSLGAGELMVIVGPNGAGKTTLMKLLTGELAAGTGTIRLGGEPVGAIPAWRLAAMRAVMAQASRLAFPFSVAEVVRIGIDSVGRALTRAERERIIAAALAAADIGHLAGRSYQTLSGGEQQRVQFARTFAQLKAGRRASERQVLFLDEPVANLDLSHQIALMESAARLARDGVGVIAVLHDLNLAATFADQVAVMNRGRLHALGAAGAVITRDMVRDVFGVDLCREAATSGGLPVVLPQNYAGTPVVLGAA